jgi:signal-transduction protein with cAMP-binding, CBS, and nucleotidyltransferase domain
VGQGEVDELDDDDARLREEQLRLGERLLDTSVRDLQPKRGACVEETATIAEAIEMMLSRRIGAALVSRGDQLVGIFTERDVLRRVAGAGVDHHRPVSEVMTPDPETLGLDDGVAFALNRMVEHGYRHIPIRGDAAGEWAVLSVRDVVAYIASLLPDRVLNLPPEPGLAARSMDGG